MAALAAAYAEGDDYIMEDETKPKCDFLITGDEQLIKKYIDTIKDQLAQGEGETFVEVGTAIDSGESGGLTQAQLEVAVKKNKELAESLGCQAYPQNIIDHKNGKFSQIVFLRQNVDEKDFIEVRVAVVGNVDAGKSTLLGVLTHNTLDDGRGRARQKLFRHKHEFDTGRTSSVGNDILGFSMDGTVVNDPNPHSGDLHWPTVCCNSAKVVTFIDLAGHEKYLKTTIFGMTGHMPDYAMLMVGANAGIVGTTREHFSLALSLKIPVLVVVTKIDMCPENILQQNMQMIDRLMRSGSAGKFPVVIRGLEDVVRVAKDFAGGTLVPIFQVSNVTGHNLDMLRAFLNMIPLHRGFDEKAPAEFHVDETFSVEGVGTVVSGTCIAGKISVGDTLLIGPDSLGYFLPFPIKSIHRKRVPVESIKAGQTGSFSAKKFSRKEVRKGMIIINPSLNPEACFEFDADVFILHHPTTIMVNYQAMAHAGPVRQTVMIKSMDKEVLRTADRAGVTFRFIKHPEYLREGLRIIFREGRTKAIGIVRKIYPVELKSKPQKTTKGKQSYPAKNNKTTRKFTPKKPN